MRKLNIVGFSLQDIYEDVVDSNSADQVDQNKDHEDFHNDCEESIASINDAKKQIEDAIDNTDTAFDAKEQVSSIVDFTEQSIDEGGLDATSVELLDKAVESIYERLGITKPENNFSLEDFGTKTSKVKSTKLACEDLKEFLVNLWETIKQIFVKMSTYLKHYVDMVFGMNTRNTLYARALLKQINMSDFPDVMENECAPVKINNSMVKHLVDYDGQALSREDLADRIKSSNKVIGKSTEIIGVFSKYVSTNKTLKDLIKDEKSFEEIKFPELFLKLNEVGEKEGIAVFDTPKDEKCEYFATDNYLGANAIFLKQPLDADRQKGHGAIKALSHCSIKHAVYIDKIVNPKPDSKAHAMINTINGKGCKELLEITLEVCENVTNTKKTQIDMIKCHENLIKQINDAQHEYNAINGDEQEFKTRVKSIHTLTVNLNRLISEIIKSINSTIVETCNVMVRYCSVSALVNKIIVIKKETSGY